MAMRAPGTRRASDWQEEEDLPAPGGLGQNGSWAGSAARERQVGFSLSFILSVFYFVILFF